MNTNAENTPVLGTIDKLSDAEQARYMGCEAVVAMGWHTFVEVGLALAEIRDGRLYREEFEDFDTYCRAKWQYSRRHLDEIISAAQLVKHLSANCAQIKPDHESQLRPRMALSLGQAQTAWEKAVEKAGGAKITAPLVKAAMQTSSSRPRPQCRSRRYAARTAQNNAAWSTTRWAKSSSC